MTNHNYDGTVRAQSSRYDPAAFRAREARRSQVIGHCRCGVDVMARDLVSGAQRGELAPLCQQCYSEDLLVDKARSDELARMLGFV